MEQTLEQAIEAESTTATCYYLVDRKAPASVNGKAVFYSYPMAGRMIVRVHPRRVEDFLEQCEREGVTAKMISVADLLGGVI